jgi:hypothetical protein
MTKTYRLLHAVYPLAVVTLVSLAATPARADFFDGARNFFTQDVPHFFQDDIPCAFGGQPTSHTRTSCRSSDHPAEPVSESGRTGPYAPPPPPPPDKSN